MIPVSRISWVGFSSSTVGAGRWIGQRSSPSTCSPSSIVSPRRLKIRPSVSLPTGHRDRRTGVEDLVAAAEAVGRVHRDGADAVVAQVLLHLADDLAFGVPGAVDLERRVDLGQLVGEERVDDDARDLLDRPDVCRCSRFPFSSAIRSFLVYPSASAPATTSKISCVISACRTRFISRVRSRIMSCAFSDALRIAVMRAPSSDAADSSSAR